MKQETWRFLIISVVILGALYYLYPTYQFYYNPPENPGELERAKRQSINLGLDLQGGIHLVLEVDPSKLSEDERHDVVDRVKETVPVWKREYGPDGAVWQEGIPPVPTDREPASPA